MSITRAQLETILIRRVGAWLTLVGRDGTTDTGSNDDLTDPIAVALVRAGYSVASIAAVTNDDLASVPIADAPRLVDLAELRALETIVQAYTSVNTSGLGYSKAASDLGARIESRIAVARAAIEQQYGIGSARAFAVGLTRSDGYTTRAADE